MSLVGSPSRLGDTALRSIGAAMLGVSLAAVMAGCTTAGKIWRQNEPILGDPTKGYGGGKDQPNLHDPYPKLGSVPARPKITETIADRRVMQNELVADRAASELFPKAPTIPAPEVAGAEPAVSAPTGAVSPAAPASPAATKTADAAGAAKSTTAAVPAQPAAAAAPGAQTAANEPKKPGMWERFFGHKTKPAPDPNAVEPLPAQPTTPVTIKPADPAVPRS